MVHQPALDRKRLRGDSSDDYVPDCFVTHAASQTCKVSQPLPPIIQIHPGFNRRLRLLHYGLAIKLRTRSEILRGGYESLSVVGIHNHQLIQRRLAQKLIAAAVQSGKDGKTAG